MTSVTGNAVYAIIGNIPANYHSSDLRNYFSQFVEGGGFDCFHFRHRPEIKRPLTENETGSHETDQCQTQRPSVTESEKKDPECECKARSSNSKAQTEDDDALISCAKSHGNSLSRQSSLMPSIVGSSQSSSPHQTDQLAATSKTVKTMCCVVKVKSEKIDQLLKMYHRKHWLDSNGESLKALCLISRIKLPETGKHSWSSYFANELSFILFSLYRTVPKI
jgi:hypothetical protein